MSLKTVTAERKDIEGNYFIRTRVGAKVHYCYVQFHPKSWGGDAYNSVGCARGVSKGRPDVFASVYNQTLEDMRGCMIPNGWTQSSSDQGACIPIGSGEGECIRRFSRGDRDVWLYSNIEENNMYSVGIQAQLGPRK